MATAEVRPKETRGILEPVANTIAVADGLMFNYYPIKLGDKKGPFRELVKIPPLIVEGFVTVGKQLFQVSTKDFIRRRVNVTSPYRATASQQSANLDVVEAVSNPEQPAVVQCIDPAIDEAANLAWQDQINALLYLDDPQEEWLPTDFTQS